MLELANRERFSTISLRDINYILFRHKWKVIVFFLAVILTVSLGTFLSPKVYKSDAMLLVRVGRESVTLDPSANTGQVISVGQSREAETYSELEVLQSRELVERLVDIIGLDTFLKGPGRKTEKGVAPTMAVEKLSSEVRHSLEDRDNIIRTVMKNLKIDVRKGSIIYLSYEDLGPERTQNMLIKLIDLYLEKHVSVHRTAGSYEFFNQQTEQLRVSIAKTDENLRKVKNKTGIASLEDQRRVLLTRINDLQRESELTYSALAASEAKVRAMEKALSDLPATMVTGETGGVGNYGADLMRSKLYELKLREQDLLSRYTEKSISVQEIRRQIVMAEALIAKEEATRTQVTKGLNEGYSRVQLDIFAEKGTLASLQAKANALREQLVNARGELKLLNDNEVQIVGLQRQLNIQEANYRKFSQNLEEARVGHALNLEKISNISVVQPPTYPLRPVRPRKTLNLALGVLLGMLGGIGLAFFSEHMDHTFKRPEDVEERLKLPLLATIPSSKENYGS